MKVDATGLQSGRTYHYVFESGGERSQIGRTKTLPAGGATRVRLASMCCSNYPSGYFNVYRCVAERHDLDAIVHVGDYIYEFENAGHGDGAGLLRIPEPRREAVTLSDYRIRYATYRSDPDLQAAHRQHPFIAVWDDHELTNDAWSGGASNHNPEQGEGDWPTRQAAAYRAYLEWMPVRELPGAGIRLYRSFRFGSLIDLIMLDTRGLRDRQARPRPRRWPIRDERCSAPLRKRGCSTSCARRNKPVQLARAGAAGAVLEGDAARVARALDRPWDGYQTARERVLDFIASERVRDVAILGGDFHSSWALDVARDPWRQYQPATGEGSLAVELLAPAISSPPLFASQTMRDRAPLLRSFLPHLKFLDGDNRGYILLDITTERIQAGLVFVPTVMERAAVETRAVGFVCEQGSSRLVAN